MQYCVRVEKVRLKFAAAHMATFGGEMEPLHGHNYSVTIEVRGALTEDSWVIDFGLLKKAGRGICDELDHKFLLQRESKVLEIDEGVSNWKIRFGERGFVFPRSDVLALPIDNTTAERLAEYFILKLKKVLRENGATNVDWIGVGVEEAPGQAGWAMVDLT
jgi:6-pyruvoyltetrahydropterin/6-carboxytetrahydropterin synthase